MSQDSGNREGDDSLTPSLGGSSSTFTPASSPPALSSALPPPVGSHEEPCGNCFPILLQHWEGRVRAERDTKEEQAPVSLDPTSGVPAQMPAFGSTSSLEVSKAGNAPTHTRTNSAPVLRSTSETASLHTVARLALSSARSSEVSKTNIPPRYTVTTNSAPVPWPTSETVPRSASHHSSFSHSSTFQPQSYTPVTPESAPFAKHMTSQNAPASTSRPLKDTENKRSKASVVRPIHSSRANTRRKARSLPYNIRLSKKTGKARNNVPSSLDKPDTKPSGKPLTLPQDSHTPSKASVKSPTPPQDGLPSLNTSFKSPEEAANWKMPLLTQITIPDMIKKLQVPEVPKIGIPEFPEARNLALPDLPKITLPEVPQMPKLQLPELNLPEMPRFNLPKISMPDFPQLFDMRPRSKSAPVFTSSSRSCSGEPEMRAASSTSMAHSKQSPRVESWEWRE